VNVRAERSGLADENTCLVDVEGGLPPSANNLLVNQPNYCVVTWPAAILSWNFTDADGESQSAYRLQIDNNSSFSSPEVDTGKIISSSNSYATQPNALSYNRTYYWRLMVWDTTDLASVWISGSPFSTPVHQYPTINFSWLPQSPMASEVVQFTDESTIYGGASKSSWSWKFTDGNPPDSNVQNPSVKFLSSADKSVTLMVTDSSGFSCQGERTISVQLPPPSWIEIPPF
jgi:PKD repeat protein